MEIRSTASRQVSVKSLGPRTRSIRPASKSSEASRRGQVAKLCRRLCGLCWSLGGHGRDQLGAAHRLAGLGQYLGGGI
jgi:hypothetical protein